MAKFYYNGVLLPEIPSDVLAEYPYCWVRLNTDKVTYDLICGKYVWYYASNLYTTSSTYVWYTARLESETFVYKTTYTDNGSFNLGGGLIWANHDIPNSSSTSTTIYFYGSEPEIPKVVKYLVKSQDVFYTITDHVLTPLEIIEPNADVFQTNGFDELPEWSTISELVNPEILYWHDTTDELPSITATMTATPFTPQTVVSPNYDMTDDTILGVECAYVTASSDVVFAISVDDGVTWYMWTGQAWGTLTDTMTGMTAETINAITTEQWAGLTLTGQLKVRMTLFDENSSFTSFVMDYIN